MPEPPHMPEATQAVFCVCTSDDVVRAAADCSSDTDGFFFAGAFADYITAEKRPHFPPVMKAAAGCVALVDFDTNPELALKSVERLRQIFLKRISIIAVGTDIHPNLLLQAIRLGCVEYLTKPISLSDLRSSLRRFAENLVSSQPARNSTGRVMAFFGAKGGVGTTTLAVHLAAHLAIAHGRKTLIIDHKHQLGHIALYLGLKDTRYHFEELLQNVDRLDADLLSGYVLHHSSGLDVLASPDRSANFREGTQEELERVMDFLRREYDCVLIDSSLPYQETKMSLIEQADDIYLVSTADVASLRDLVRLVDHIVQVPNADSRLRIVMNRATSNESITGEQIRRIVRFPVAHTVPNNYFELLKSINLGEPIPPGNKTPFDLALARWTSEIVGTSSIEVPRTRAEKKKERRFGIWPPRGLFAPSPA
jgi:pilus assembly protein CpaE